MVSDITNNLKNALETLSTYGGTPTVELERLYLDINGRYPYIEISGPHSEVEAQIHNVTDTKLEYVIKYYINYNDEDYANDSAITFVTRNVAGDITQKVMADVTRGGYAIKTSVVGYGNAFEAMEERVEYFIYVVLEISARIDAKDPTFLG